MNDIRNTSKIHCKSVLIGFISGVVLCILLLFLFRIVEKNIINTSSLEDAVDVEFGEFFGNTNLLLGGSSLDVTVTNKTNKQKSFVLTIEASDKDGVRIDTDTVFADRVKPNQKVRVVAFKYIPEEKTEQYKNAVFSVLEIQER